MKGLHIQVMNQRLERRDLFPSGVESENLSSCCGKGGEGWGRKNSRESRTGNEWGRARPEGQGKASQGACFNQGPATILGPQKGNMLRCISLNLCQNLHAIQVN